MSLRFSGVMLLSLLTTILSASNVAAADHGDTPILRTLSRTDAQITDFYAFWWGENIELVLCVNPNIPTTATTYQFAPDMTATIHVDHHSRVERDDVVDLAQFGGTIVKPSAVAENISLEVTFNDNGKPHLHTTGIAKKYREQIRLFAGLRDDPFIRKPRKGRNVAAIVVELPAEALLGKRSDLLLWATTKVPDLAGPISDHAGRALRSMFNEPMNMLRPREHWLLLEEVPDVVILSQLSPSGFPNGRELTDDVIDLVSDLPPNAFGDEDRTTTDTNDAEFLPFFPFLAEPHAPPDP